MGIDRLPGRTEVESAHPAVQDFTRKPMILGPAKLVRKPGFAPGPSRSQRGMLLLHHNPDGMPSRSSESEGWSPWSDSHRVLAHGHHTSSRNSPCCC